MSKPGDEQVVSEMMDAVVERLGLESERARAAAVALATGRAHVACEILHKRSPVYAYRLYREIAEWR